MPGYSTKKRTRAWFFIKVKSGANANTVAKAIYEKHGGTKGSNQFVLVRADVVSGCTLGEIIASVDAIIDDPQSPKKALIKAEEKIQKVTGVASTTNALVSAHIPDPPHEAYGYVNKAEKVKGLEKGVKDVNIAGRQSPYSPGSNKWG